MPLDRRTVVTLWHHAAIATAIAAGLGVTLAAGPLSAFDYDHDGRADWAIVRPDTATSRLNWYIQNSEGVSAFAWGLAGDVPVGGDWDGDGRSDAAVWQPRAGAFAILRSAGGSVSVKLGSRGDVPVVGDYDGDGRTDAALYRDGTLAGAQSYFWIRRSRDAGTIAVPWGLGGDVPVAGDYDGDGRMDPAVRRVSGDASVFYIARSTGGWSSVTWGLASDTAAPGDYDADGRTDVTVVRRSGNDFVWYILQSRDGSMRAGAFGLASSDLPAPADYDGDGATDVAVLRHSDVPGASGFWVLQSSGGVVFHPFGASGAVSVAGIPLQTASPPRVIVNDDFDGHALFPSDNWWNQDISQAPVDQNSANFISFVGTNRALHPDFGPPPYGIPYFSVGGTQPRVPVTFVSYPGESDAGFGGVPGYPIPDAAKTQPNYIEGGVPGGGTSGDRHMLIVDRDRQLLFELYGTRWNTTLARWQAGSGAIYDLAVNGRRPDTWTSADAAGLAILPGLVRYEEAVSGRPITHAFRVTVSSTNGYVWPASHQAGSTGGALPMGARLRLKASKNLSGYSPYLQRIFHAMQVYGLIVADNGSDMYISGAMDARWNNDSLNPAFGSLKASDFEVVQLGWQ